MSDEFKPLIAAAARGPLDSADATRAFELMMSGEATPTQIGGFLMALHTRGETVDEIAAAAGVMRAKAASVAAPDDSIDIVGTGGDGRHTLNVSTAAALITAGAGVPVAKHGNRAISSKAGAADALTALGVEVMVGPDAVAEAIREAGIGFMMAPMHHAAMRHVGPSRQELGTRTIFNILGPLTNPAGVKRQLTGVYSDELRHPVAEALQALGTVAAWVVHGGDGSDEISISGPTQVSVLADGAVTERQVTPADAGLPTHPEDAIRGGEADANAAALRDLLAGTPSAFRDASVLNAAAALVIAGRAVDLSDGAALATESIDSGAARNALERLVAISVKHRS